MATMHALLRIAAFLVVCCWFQSLSLAQAERIENGCNIVKKATKLDVSSSPWKTTPLPFLNCSALNWTSFNFTAQDLMNVTSLDLTHNILSEIQVDLLKPLQKLEKLELGFVKLRRLVESSDALELSSVIYLSLAHNELTYIPDKALKTFPNLQTLELFDNSITVLKTNDFRHNKKLKHLFIGPNPIAKLDSGWMANSNLQTLTLRDCGLKEIPSELSSMTDIERLVLADNRIKTIPARTFSNSTALKILDLGSNRIDNIEIGAFDGAESLHEIDLSDNNLKTLEKGCFKGINHENLQLDLYENPLDCNCSLQWFKLWTNRVERKDMSTKIHFKCYNPARNHGKKAHQITVDEFSCQKADQPWQECKLKHVQSTKPATKPVAKQPSKPTTQPPKPVVHLSSRTCLKLCCCYDEAGELYFDDKATPPKHTMRKVNEKNNPSIYCMHAAAMTSFPLDIRSDVVEIRISQMKLKSLQLESLKRYQQLKALTLTDGDLQDIVDSPTTFAHVKMLNLNNNKFSSITKYHLRHFPNLELLSLHENQISELADDIFHFNRKLSTIHLGSNLIKDFHDHIFNGLNLEKVSLRNMSLKAIPKSLQESDQITFLDFRENRLATLQKRHFSKCKSLQTVLLQNNQIETVESHAFSGAKSLRVIKLSGNKIKWLSESAFVYIALGRLEISLWGNPLNCTCALKPFKQWVELKETQHPGSDIQFQCYQPLKLHGKTSTEFSAESDMKCQKEYIYYANTSGFCSVAGRIAMAVILTMLFTIAAGGIVWKCKRKRNDAELRYFAKF